MGRLFFYLVNVSTTIVLMLKLPIREQGQNLMAVILVCRALLPYFTIVLC
jgi:hypothetical protein